MQHVRLGGVGYVLFALACLLPGWWLRDIVAAELQLRDAAAALLEDREVETPAGRSPPRRLGPRGTRYLLNVLSDNSDLDQSTLHIDGAVAEFPPPMFGRRGAACMLLWNHDDPGVLQARMRALTPKEQEDAIEDSADWNWRDHRDKIAASLDGVSEEHIHVVLRSLSKTWQSRGTGTPSVTFGEGRILWLLWSLRPDRCERVVSSVLGTTNDSRLASFLASRGYQDENCWSGIHVLAFDSCSQGNHDRRMRAIRTGLSNPNEEVRRVCERALVEAEPLDGWNGCDPATWRKNDGR